MLLISVQISLERMDEVFGTADFSKVEDVGLAAKRAVEEDGSVHTVKV